MFGLGSGYVCWVCLRGIYFPVKTPAWFLLNSISNGWRTLRTEQYFQSNKRMYVKTNEGNITIDLKLSLDPWSIDARLARKTAEVQLCVGDMLWGHFKTPCGIFREVSEAGVPTGIFHAKVKPNSKIPCDFEKKHGNSPQFATLDARGIFFLFHLREL